MVPKGIAVATPRMRRSHMRATLYTRQGCQLCDKAEAILVRHGFDVESIDIDQDDQLQERYNACVPVVLIEGQERFRGRINETLLRRLRSS